MKNIVFISHDASRTGAPVLLLNLIRILKEDGYYIKVILKDGRGGLRDDFDKVADELFIYYLPFKGLLGRIKKKINGYRHEYRFGKILRNTDLLISNTLTNGGITEYCTRYYKGAIITYVHELEMGAKYFTTPEKVEKVLQISKLFLVPCEAVKKFITEDLKVSASKVIKLNSYILKSEMTSGHHFDERKKLLKANFIVGSMGTADWRKSPDLFILAAKIFFDKNPGADVQFIWKGAEKKSVASSRLEYDIKKLCLGDKIIIEDASFETASFYNQIDLFLLTSREDPYPLVVLEAASYGKPTIFFKDTGGIVEFIEDDAGSSVSYLDIEAMADKIGIYYMNRNLLLEHGNIAKMKVHKMHCNKNLILKQFNKIIAEL